MHLLQYLRMLSPEERKAFASNCETTENYLWKLARGFHSEKKLRPAAEMSVSIETHSNQKVRRWESNPERWHRIWPEIIGSPGAPGIAANDESGMQEAA